MNNVNSAIGVVEAVLFAVAQPLSAQKLSELTGIGRTEIVSILDEISARLDERDSGIELLRLEDRYQFATRKIYSETVEHALVSRRSQPLSQAANEVLAIIAYNQPVTRSFIDQIRGVDSASAVSSLVARGLVSETGRLDLPGRPIGYGTTDLFLRSYALSSLADLPHIERGSDDEDSDETGDI